MKEPKPGETRMNLQSNSAERLRKQKEIQLFDAIEASAEQVVRELVASGVSVDVRRWSDGWQTPLGRAIHTSQQDSMVTFLIESGARTVNGYTLKDATIEALKNRNIPQAALALLKLTIQDIHKTRGLVAAIKGNHTEAARVLLNSGANIDAQDPTETAPIIVAAENGSHEVAKLLLDYSPNLYLTNRDGRTALDAAVEKDDEIMACLLLEHLPLKNDAQYSRVLALDRAIGRKDYRMALSLLDNGQCVVLRGVKTFQLKNDGGQHPIVGPDNLYMKTLCLTTRNLQIEAQTISHRNDATDSDQSFLNASEWLLNCLTRHAACISAEGPLPNLPTRVIDVGPPDGSQELVLRPGRGLQGRYIALTHRWGVSVTMKSTKQSLSEWLKCIKFQCLTKVMQDAVTVTRKLGIRYLWIDALCIIQDSHSDWSVEACDMARIYRNAFLTIAAAASADHSDGFFTKRNQAPTSQASANEILDSRGWIMQEQLLSPRILKYSKGQMDWECISLSTSDGNQTNTARSVTSSEIIRFKRAVRGFRSTSMAVQKQAHASWQHIVQSYSHRELTNEADKLMAVMGIARFTGEIMGDCFLAGLWRGQLWRDLLWKLDVSSYGGYLPPRVRKIKLPSWSWASAGGPVAYSWPAGSSPGSVESSLLLISADVDSDISNGDVQGRLVMNARMRKVFFRERDSGRLFHRESVNPRLAERVVDDKEREEISNGRIMANLDGLRERSSVDAPAQVSSSTGVLPKRSRERLGPPVGIQEDNDDDKPEVTRYGCDINAELAESAKNVRGKGVLRHDWFEEFWLDAADECFTEAWLLPVASEYYWIYCLAVVDTGNRNEFRRVGFCNFDRVRSPSFFNGANETMISLV
ncbi:HET-domain-containing protein [Xylariaceae sp. AK1471]|nr:HET-domain-containing protein [Xylariaceae sp. AK1471]